MSRLTTSAQLPTGSERYRLPVLPAELRRKGFENAIGNASSSPQRFDPLFWRTNNDETTSVGMRSATDNKSRPDIGREDLALAPRRGHTEARIPLLQTTVKGTGIPQKQILASVPVGRLLRAEELCATVRFMCLGDVRFLTGTTFVLDGGYTAM
jgi:hypothetical protein